MTNIRIRNIYYMLSYAFHALRQDSFKNIETENFENTADLFSCILAQGLKLLSKQGLNREYVDITEEIAGVRGKINISDCIKYNTFRNKKLICAFDEFSINSYMNRIILTTADLLLRSGIKKKYAKLLKKQLIYFDGVELLDRENIKWDIQYNRCNKAYELLINICYLVVKGLLLSDKEGHTKMGRYIDDQNMHRLYEKFLLEYYRYHYPELRARSMIIEWDEQSNNTYLLPKMLTDITLSKGNDVLIIDAKYYTHNVQSNNDRVTANSNNLYQIYAYVNNYIATKEKKSGKVAGMLLYAETQDEIQANSDYIISGNKISVKTLDLNREFAEISDQLNNIAVSYFDL